MQYLNDKTQSSQVMTLVEKRGCVVILSQKESIHDEQ